MSVSPTIDNKKQYFLTNFDSPYSLYPIDDNRTSVTVSTATTLFPSHFTPLFVNASVRGGDRSSPTNLDLIKFHKNYINQSKSVMGGRRSSPTDFGELTTRVADGQGTYCDYCSLIVGGGNSVVYKNRNTFMSAMLAAIPTLHLHLLLSLTMMLITHRCPQYLLVL